MRKESGVRRQESECLAILLLFPVCLLAQIELPRIGEIVDEAGALRPVWGVAGSFLAGPAAAGGVVSVACSEQLCLAKTDSKILSTSGETNAPPGPAVFALDGDGAIVYFPELKSFARWHGDTLDALNWTPAGEVLSIRAGPGAVEIAVRRDGQVWIERPDGGVLDAVPNATGPVLLLEEGVLFATEREVVLRRPDASVAQFELAGADAMWVAGPHYAGIRSNDAIYVLRTERGREQLFLLPRGTP